MNVICEGHQFLAKQTQTKRKSLKGFCEIHYLHAACGRADRNLRANISSLGCLNECRSVESFQLLIFLDVSPEFENENNYFLTMFCAFRNGFKLDLFFQLFLLANNKLKLNITLNVMSQRAPSVLSQAPEWFNKHLLQQGEKTRGDCKQRAKFAANWGSIKLGITDCARLLRL